MPNMKNAVKKVKVNVKKNESNNHYEASMKTAMKNVERAVASNDKKKAEKGKWRIPEKGLLAIALFGGAFGSYPAMLICRHKTKREHWYFTFCNLLGILIHTTIFLLIVFLWKIQN